jgi:hypothetical protein
MRIFGPDKSAMIATDRFARFAAVRVFDVLLVCGEFAGEK